MTFFAKRKRKNDEQRPFPAWVIVLVALGVVVVAALLFQPAGRSVSESSSQQVFPTPDGIELTATTVIQRATSFAQGTSQPIKNNMDAFQLTATAIVQEATQRAAQPGS